MCCERCGEPESYTTTDKMTCIVCGRTVKTEYLVEGVCRDCLRKHLGLRLKVKRVCSKCGREMGKGQADVKCPYCGGNVINVTVIKRKGEK